MLEPWSVRRRDSLPVHRSQVTSLKRREAVRGGEGHLLGRGGGDSTAWGGAIRPWSEVCVTLVGGHNRPDGWVDSDKAARPARFTAELDQGSVERRVENGTGSRPAGEC